MSKDSVDWVKFAKNKDEEDKRNERRMASRNSRGIIRREGEGTERASTIDLSNKSTAFKLEWNFECAKTSEPEEREINASRDAIFSEYPKVASKENVKILLAFGIPEEEIRKIFDQLINKLEQRFNRRIKRKKEEKRRKFSDKNIYLISKIDFFGKEDGKKSYDSLWVSLFVEDSNKVALFFLIKKFEFIRRGSKLEDGDRVGFSVLEDEDYPTK